jgi:predicted nucleic acid-binding protein
MIVLDASVLLLFLKPDAPAPTYPGTTDPVERAADRIAHLIDTLAADREKIVIPTPALSEILVYAGDAISDYLSILNAKAVFRIAPFDEKAAIEAALAHRDALERGGLRVDATDPRVSKAKVKFDRQIVAIAVAEGAHTVFSDDDDVIGYAKRIRLKAFRTADLDLPPEDPQSDMFTS